MAGGTYQVAGLSRATSVDEDDGRARSAVTVAQIIAGGAAAELASLNGSGSILIGGQGRGRGGEKSSDDGELHGDWRYWNPRNEELDENETEG